MDTPPEHDHRSRGKLQVIRGDAPDSVTSSAGGHGPRGRGLDPDKLAALRALLADESLGRNEIARRAGVSAGIVSAVAREVGRTFLRKEQASTPVVASAARSADLLMGRKELAENLASAVAQIMSQLRELLPARDTRATGDLSRAAAALVRAAVDLDRLEIDRQRAASAARGGSEVDSWLDEMTGTDGQQ